MYRRIANLSVVQHLQGPFFVVNQKVFKLQQNKDFGILLPLNFDATLHQAAILA